MRSSSRSPKNARAASEPRPLTPEAETRAPGVEATATCESLSLLGRPASVCLLKGFINPPYSATCESVQATAHVKQWKNPPYKHVFQSQCGGLLIKSLHFRAHGGSGERVMKMCDLRNTHPRRILHLTRSFEPLHVHALQVVYAGAPKSVYGASTKRWEGSEIGEQRRM